MRNWRKEMLKKSVLVVAVLLVATNLWAVQGPMDVSKTRHNLSSTLDATNLPGADYFSASNEDEVCIFCHTPHGGTMNTPLWNRALPTGAFTHYTSSTLTSTVGAANRAVSPESLLCMSCHDGVTAMNSIINNSNRTGAAPDTAANLVPMFGLTTGGAIGSIIIGGVLQPDTRNLSDDHPISFSYLLALGDGNATNLHTLQDAKNAGVRFFGPEVANSTGSRVECSSCHDPHVNYTAANGGNAAYSPFLITPNTGSALCLACHIK